MRNRKPSFFKDILAILLFIPVFILICIIIYYVLRNTAISALLDVISKST